MSKALCTAWAVCIKPKRGGWWSHTDFTGRIRTEAIKKYEHNMLPGTFAREKRKGHVKCVRVELREVDG